MNKLKAISLSGFFLFHFFSYAKPLPINKNRSANSNIIDRLGQWSLVKFCEKNQISDKGLNALEKSRIIVSDANKSAILLLYEFATNTGPVHSYWYKYHPYTQLFLKGEGMKYICNQYIKLNQNDTFKSVEDIRYQFSAKVIPCRPNTWYFAFSQNYKVLKANNLAQFVLGSFNVQVTVINQELFHFTVINRMSRKSLFIGLGPRVSRPKPLGTTFQTISFTLTKAEMLERIIKK